MPGPQPPRSLGWPGWAPRSSPLTEAQLEPGPQAAAGRGLAVRARKGRATASGRYFRPMSQPSLQRRLGLVQATALNMIDMVGIGPFVTLPLVMGFMGPNFLLAWMVGAGLAVVDGLAERMGMMREVRNFIAVIIDHQRLNQLDEIIAEYLRVADTSAGLTDAEVTSAHPLDDANRAELESQITRLAGSRVRIAYHLDASLLGGAVVKIGSTVYDGSVRMQLQQMKETLTRA